MEAFSGYNQIKMVQEDEEHTTFILDKSLYYCKVISFGLKNARATYQRMVKKMFQHQIKRNMEVYGWYASIELLRIYSSIQPGRNIYNYQKISDAATPR